MLTTTAGNRFEKIEPSYVIFVMIYHHTVGLMWHICVTQTDLSNVVMKIYNKYV